MQQENCTTKRDRIQESAKLTLNIKEARFYFTQNLTEWERRSIAWDLFQYGQEVLEKVAQPSYSFTVDSADFLVMDEFETFKNALSLGKRAYLKLDNGRVLTPLLLGFSHTFDEKSGLTLEFSNKFTSNDENDRLVDLLEQSVSMGKKLDLSREVYSAFVNSHANTAIHDFMNGALDVAKNAILSTTGQAISWDENGLRLRKWADDSKTSYDPHQVWMMNENIVFTDDGWQTAKMAVGHIVDPKFATKGNPNGDLWGVVAPNLIGNKLIGENCAFYGSDPSGQGMSFQFDAQGLYSYNARQYWRGQSGGFSMLDPDYGFMLGTEGNPLIVGDDGRVRPSCIDENNELIFEDMGKYSTKKIPKGMNLYMGIDGNLYMRGDFYANDIYVENGTFNGVVKAQDFQLPSGDSMVSVLNEQGKIKGDYIDAKGINIKDPTTGDTVLYMDATGIHWAAKYSPIKYQYATSASGPWHDTRSANDEYRRESTDGGTTWSDGIKFVARDGRNGSDGVVDYSRVNKILKDVYGISTTEITEDSVSSAYICGANIIGGNFYCGSSGGFQLKSSGGGDIISMYPANDSGAFAANGLNGCIGTSYDILLAPGGGGGGLGGAVYIVQGGQKFAVLHSGSPIHATFV